jgi:2-polyprenyl-3-methyl-5-hydroxy-6-metoxy-1,4-benzoquinol methylase
MLGRIKRSIKWRLGFLSAAPELEAGTDDSISDFYNRRITRCEFLNDPEHYEYPRATWVLSVINGGKLLEIGSGNGGMTRLLVPKVDSVTALDVSRPSLDELEKMGLPNLKVVQGLIENFQTEEQFDWVLMSEVIEHLREPLKAICKAFEFVAPGGSLVLTTPNGHWESDEHLHEFSMRTFAEMITKTGCESFECSYLRDRENRRRWLTAIVRKPKTEPSPDDFFDRFAIMRKRFSLP